MMSLRYQELLRIAKEYPQWYIAVLEQLVIKKVIDKDVVEAIANKLAATEDAYSLYYYSLSQRLSDISHSDKLKNVNINDLHLYQYLNDTLYTPTKLDLDTILLGCLSNTLLAACINTKIIDEPLVISDEQARYVMNRLSSSLNIEGISLLIDNGYSPFYSTFDTLISTLNSIAQLGNTQITEVAKELVSNIICKYAIHGYDLDESQRERIVMLIPNLHNKLVEIEKVPQ